MKQKPILIILLIALLTVSVFFNFTLYQEQKIAKDKIEKFLPAAAQVESEIMMLRNNNKDLVTQLTSLQMEKDSSKKTNPNYTSIAPPVLSQNPAEQAPAQPSVLVPYTQQGEYIDLQKPKGKQ